MSEQVFFWKKTPTQIALEQKDKEIKRLNNIIEEVNHLLQVYLDTQEDKVWRMHFYKIKEKIRKLKGSDNNGN